MLTTKIGEGEGGFVGGIANMMTRASEAVSFEKIIG
jgi:hypothetical protein